MAWKSLIWKNFAIITSGFLSSFMDVNDTQKIFNWTDEMILRHHQPRNLSPLVRENWEFTSMLGIEKVSYENSTRNMLPACKNIPILVVKNKIRRYQGRKFVQKPKVYPDDGSDHVLQTCKNPSFKIDCEGNPLLDESKAYMVANKYLNSTYPG